MEATAPGRLNRRALIGLIAAAGVTPAAAAVPEELRVDGRLVQGGYGIGRTRPRAEIFLNGAPVGPASEAGLFVLGFDRDEAPTATVEARSQGAVLTRTLAIAPGVFDEQRIDGLPQDQVSPTDPALLERIKRETAEKTAAFAGRADADWFKDGFIWPLEAFKVTGRFGNRRILNGEPKRPHYGIDLAAPAGTPIRAPAPGLVMLAEPALWFEGGLTLIDHGQGLIAAYLHQSAQHVRAGDQVTRGQVIGAVGQTGRATGPHLCWRLKWQGRNLDPSLLVA
jgi:murein DD-endopeptidase MepM/ murein hydrolase activator NlpD